jgi:hypothetical protein
MGILVTTRDIQRHTNTGENIHFFEDEIRIERVWDWLYRNIFYAVKIRRVPYGFL